MDVVVTVIIVRAPAARAPDLGELNVDIGKIGIWAFLDLVPAAESQAAAREIEDLGFKALWIPEAIGREVFTSSAVLLAGTKSLVIATGIANVWARDAMAMATPPPTKSRRVSP